MYYNRGKILHRTLNLPVKFEKYLEAHNLQSTGPDGNAEGMKRLYWGLDAYVVKCNHYLYKVTADEYNKLAAQV